MKLGKNEYTTKGFLDFLKEKYSKKLNGKSFTPNDVAQYLLRGYTPHRYGNHIITSEEQNGVRIIKIKDSK